MELLLTKSKGFLFRMVLLAILTVVWSHCYSQTITYSREFLLDLRWKGPSLDSSHPPVFPSYGLSSNDRGTFVFNRVKARKQGKKGGLRQRL